jgi:hypothetical protein
MSVLATLVSYGCIQVFVACCVLRWAHGRGAWVTREAVSESTGFREAATRTVERWWMPKEALWGTTLTVALGLGGVWPAAWTVELVRRSPAYPFGWSPTGGEVALAGLFAGLLLGPALAALRVVLRRPVAAAQAQTVGIAALIVALAMLLPVVPGWHFGAYWPGDLAWCRWIPAVLALVALGGSVSLIRAGAQAEAAETAFLAEPDPQT